MPLAHLPNKGHLDGFQVVTTMNKGIPVCQDLKIFMLENVEV